MNVDTGQFRAITAERDQLRSDAAAAVDRTVRMARLIEACASVLANPRAPVPPVVSTRGRHRSARRPRWQPKVIQGGRA